MRKLTLFIILIILVSGGCFMPPKRIPKDREAYTRAINRSWKEQLLNNLVRLRKGDSLTLLELTSITTSYSLGLEGTAGYSGGLELTTEIGTATTETRTFAPGVTGGGTIRYSRSPSVTYSPIRGETLRKIIMDPISLDTVLKTLQVDTFSPHILPLTVEFITVESKKTFRNNSEEFFKFGRFLKELRKIGIIKINIEGVKEDTSTFEKKTEIGDLKKDKKQTTTTKTVKHNIPQYCLIVDGKLPSQFENLLRVRKSVKKKYQIYGYQPDRPEDLDENVGVIFFQTRSIMQILGLLSQPGGLSGKDLNSKEPLGSNVIFLIKESINRPKAAFVSIKHGDLWYYIDESDENSKKLFSLMVLILAMSESSGK